MLNSGIPTYKVLIIGCGNIAGEFDAHRSRNLPPLSHAGAYTKHEGFNIDACIDPNVNKLNNFAKRWNVKIAVQDFEELNSSPGDFDVISICSPTSLHEIHIQEALRLNPRLIFCEKPLTSNIESSIRILNECKKNGIALAVNYSRHWDLSIAALIEDLKVGRWGKIRSVVGHYNKGMLNNGGHMIDLLLRILGPLNVVATAGVIYDFWPDDPTIGVLFSAISGRVPVYMGPADARDYSYFELELVCELGVIRMESGGLSWRIRGVKPSSQFNGYKELGVAQNIDGSYLDSMTSAVENIYQYLYGGAPIMCNGEDALQIQRVCHQIKMMA
jgi:predicted dehydrogenase